MKSIYKKIDISITLIIVIFISFLSGLFKDILTFLSIIIIHELGHVIMSLKYKWNIKKIKIDICGGFIFYDENIDKPFKEELIISVAGFLSQSIFYLICFIIYKFNFINLKTFDLIEKYYLSILIFNLIPIIPLDGSKILNIFFNMFFSYKKSLKLLNIVSFLFIIFILTIFLFLNFKIEYSYIMILIFIIYNLFNSIKSVPHLFNRFLFERYTYPIRVKKYENIKGYKLNKMKRQTKHYFIINNKSYSENTILSKRFD